MADMGEVFDPEAVPKSDRNFEPLPAGTYQVQVTESEVVDMKSGNGQQLVLTLEVMDGAFANRKMWDRLNIRHTNAQAQSIAQRALADLFLATGTPPSRDSEDLHFKPCMARVAIENKDANYPAKNVIKAYKPAQSAPQASRAPATRAPAAQQQRPAASAAPPPRQAAAAGSRPWSR